MTRPRHPNAAARRLVLPTLLGLALSLVLVGGLVRAAQEAGADPPAAPRLTDSQEARAQDLEGRLKCPVCRVQSVRESNSFMALEMRARIRELVLAGRSDDEILRYFTDRYGDYILLEPRKQGFGLTAWALPLLAVAGGAVLLLVARRRRRSGAVRGSGFTAESGGAEEPALVAGRDPAALSPEDARRVSEELKRYTI